MLKRRSKKYALWGSYKGQSVGTKSRGKGKKLYIKGFDSRDKYVEIVVELQDVDDLIGSMLEVKP